MPLLHLGLKFTFRHRSWKLFSKKMTYSEICQELLLCLDVFHFLLPDSLMGLLN